LAIKIRTLEELRQLRENLKAESLIDIAAEKEGQFVLAVGMATCGIAAGAEAVMEALKEEIVSQNLTDTVTLVSTGCLGHCYMEPMVEVRMAGNSSILYGEVTADKARRIVREHLLKGQILEQAIIGKKVKRV